MLSQASTTAGPYAGKVNFSVRSAWEETEDPWAAELESARQAGRIVADLTSSNPTACGLTWTPEEVLAPLAARESLRYEPNPLGMRRAREAVASYYRDHGAEIPAEHICLTTSTSEAYSYLFRLVCDPGDEILIAQPSYPLFDVLAQLEGVILRTFSLLYDPGTVAAQGGGWHIDLHAVETGITKRTRAVVLVHPNNPTGNYVSREDRLVLRRLCAAHDLALLVDEVFLDYALSPADPGVVSFAAPEEAEDCLCFVLSGISKVCALPQMKLSWIAAKGPTPLVQRAMSRLEMIADAFLSVNAPTQQALPWWLEARHGVQARVRERVRENLAYLDGQLEGTLASRFSVGGGWTVVLRVPASLDGEEFALAALRRGVVVQPGALYGLPAGRCVLSLLTMPEVWHQGLMLLPIRPWLADA